MKVLVTGRGGAGSWTVRGEQIGEALGARVKRSASLAEMKAADVVLVVKRVGEELLADLRRSGRPWAYDIVDAYPQPECSAWPRDVAIAWARDHLKRLKPDAVIWPNAAMRADCGGGGKVVYHHHRPGIRRNPIRNRIERIGYDGATHYLEGWEKAISKACRAVGAVFVANPPHLADVDVVLALRGRKWNGYAQENWKSNVKLANAHGSGTPFVGSPENGYRETQAGGEQWASSGDELVAAIERLADPRVREVVAASFLPAAITVEDAAKQVREVLCALKC